jgi:hypothetical protein
MAEDSWLLWESHKSRVFDGSQVQRVGMGILCAVQKRRNVFCLCSIIEQRAIGLAVAIWKNVKNGVRLMNAFYKTLLLVAVQLSLTGCMDLESLGDRQITETDPSNPGTQTVSSDPDQIVFAGLEELTELGHTRPATCEKGTWSGPLENSYSISALIQMEDIIGYTRVPGHLVVNSSRLQNMNFLSCLESVGGDLVLYGLTSFEGLENLREVGGVLVIKDSPVLSGLGPFPSLERVGGLELRNLPIRNVVGLESIQELPLGLDISFNLQLTELEGLNNLVRIGVGDVPSDGPASRLEQSVRIYTNTALKTLDGLAGVEEVEGEIELSSNSSLSQCEITEWYEQFDADAISMANDDDAGCDS